MVKELRTLWQKSFGTSSPKPSKIKKPIRAKPQTREQKIGGLISEIGREMFDMPIHVELGRCPYCGCIAHMLSTQPGLFRCSNCKETTRQYINGKISYLPVNDRSVLGNESEES